MPLLRTSAPNYLREVRETDLFRRILRGVRAETGGRVPKMPYHADTPEATMREVQKGAPRLREARMKTSETKASLSLKDTLTN